MATQQAILEAIIDVKKAVEGSKKWNQATGSMETSTKKTDSAMKSLAKGISLVAVGYAGWRVIKFATKQMVEQERVLAQLSVGLKSTNFISGQTVEGIQKISASMQQQTGIANEEIEQIAAVGLSFTNITGKVFPEFLKISADVATRMGTDLQSTALQLAKALNDPVANLGALSRAGIQFTKEQKETIKVLWESGRAMDAQAVIMKELETQYGGSAEAARDTLGGAMKALKEEMNDLGKNLGGLFFGKNKEGIEVFISLLLKLNKALENNPISKSGGLWSNLQASSDYIFGVSGSTSGDPYRALGVRNRLRQQKEKERRARMEQNTSDQVSNGNNLLDNNGEALAYLREKYGAQDESDQISEVLTRYRRELTETEETMMRLADASQQFGDTFGSALEDAVFSGKDLRTVIQGLGQDILQMVFRQTVTQPISNLISTGIKTAMTPSSVTDGTAAAATQKTGGTVNVIVSQKIDKDEIMLAVNDLNNEFGGHN